MAQPDHIFYDLLTRVGNRGTYQTVTLTIIYLINFIGSSVFFINPYLFYQQTFICNGNQSSHCTNYVCGLPSN